MDQGVHFSIKPRNLQKYAIPSPECHTHSISADKAQREAKFDIYSQVYLKTQTAGGERAHVMTVKARRKIAKIYKKTTYISYEYQLEDSANQLYEKGAWIPEKQLESCDGS
jgi:hypothetical protein